MTANQNQPDECRATAQATLTDEGLAHRIACELASIDGHDPEDMNGELYHLRWSGGSCPEPLGDMFSLEYLPKAERIARTIEQHTAQATRRKGDTE